ncbi:hypothetical protein [Nocardioides marmorisolisilvae]|uniref:Uncharacterized protein n=1 Tax=Nocardioides marmorisolisilvae TaxID=1542737 RepID=A0A3N0E0R3_9ACTN|nr:hypothetical protein [Nocardioides marmorisolisilvae]RNL81333.1 hypothetical protein EFL95_02990 [Nocardioides marmorisolisilvae]
MLVIALVLVLIAVGCAVLIAEASRSLVPVVGPDAQILTHSATPDQATAPVVPTQRTATESARAAATYGFIAELPAEKTNTVRVNL